MAFLLVCTPLGHPFKRRLLRLGPNSSKAAQFNTPELEGHTFEFRSPHAIGTPAPPYEWILRVTPPPPPTAHFSSDVAHIAPILTHRFSDIPRVPSGHGLGIQVKEEKDEEKRSIETPEKEKPVAVGPDSNPDCSEVKKGTLVSKPVQPSPSRPLSASEIGRPEMRAVLGEAERQARQDRYRALFLQSDELSRRKILATMSEEDRMAVLAP